MRISRWINLAGAAAILGAACLSFVSASADESAAKKHGPIAWTESFATAQKTAAKEKKPIFVDFYADWCGPCQQMLKTTYKDSAVVAKSKQFVPVLINIDKNEQLARKYEIASIPAVIFFDSKGKVVARADGYHDAEEFVKLMDSAAKRAKH